jgi:chromosome segregation ATPase
MARFKLINGTRVEFTAEEEALRDAEELEWQNSEFDRSMEELRIKRNSLLAQTDYLALSDQTMSAEMTTYRQALRDITNGLTTVEDVEAVVFPEKPEA